MVTIVTAILGWAIVAGVVLIANAEQPRCAVRRWSRILLLPPIAALGLWLGLRPAVADVPTQDLAHVAIVFDSNEYKPQFMASTRDVDECRRAAAKLDAMHRSELAQAGARVVCLIIAGERT